MTQPLRLCICTWSVQLPALIITNTTRVLMCTVPTSKYKGYTWWATGLGCKSSAVVTTAQHHLHLKMETEQLSVTCNYGHNHKVCFVARWLVCTHYICVLLQLICCVNELTEVFVFFVVPFCRGQLEKKESLRTTGEWRKPTEMPRQAVRVLPVKMVSIVKVWGPTVHTPKFVSIKCIYIIYCTKTLLYCVTQHSKFLTPPSTPCLLYLKCNVCYLIDNTQRYELS